MTDTTLEQIAAQIREACLKAALQAYEDAGVQGLCAEGRWEAAVSAMQSVDVTALLGTTKAPPP
jgi:hypothetical protein